MSDIVVYANFRMSMQRMCPILICKTLKKKSSSDKVKSRWLGRYKPHEELEGMFVHQLESLCRPRSDFALRQHSGRFTTNLADHEVLVTPVMLHHGFLMPLTDEIAQLPLHFDLCPIQLPPAIILIYERSKLLEKAFHVKFGFEDSGLLVSVLGKHGPDYPICKV